MAFGLLDPDKLAAIMTDFREPSAPPGPSPTPPPPAYSEVCPLNNHPPETSIVVTSPRSKLLIVGLVALTLLLLGLVVTVVGLVLEVISLRAALGSLDKESVGEVKGSVRRLETNMHNSTKYYLVKLNSLYQRVAALEVEMKNSGKQLLVTPEVLFTTVFSLLLLNWSHIHLQASSAGITLELAKILQLFILAVCWLEGCSV